MPSRPVAARPAGRPLIDLPIAHWPRPRARARLEPRCDTQVVAQRGGKGPPPVSVSVGARQPRCDLPKRVVSLVGVGRAGGQVRVDQADRRSGHRQPDGGAALVASAGLAQPEAALDNVPPHVRHDRHDGRSSVDEQQHPHALLDADQHVGAGVHAGQGRLDARRALAPTGAVVGQHVARAQ
eukprot:scaffold5431_cov93-Isochrysis_galbana.AAC.5